MSVSKAIGVATTATGQGGLSLNGYVYMYGASLASLAAQLVKNPPTVQETRLIPGLERSPGEGIGYPTVKNLPAM